MSGGDPGDIVVSVCISCRAAEGANDASPGSDLLTNLRERLPPGVALRPVQCLSVCKRPATVALTGRGRYTYLFGDIDPACGVDDLLACIETYRTREHGYMLWRERPETLRRGVLARIPPPGWQPEDGAHPR
jgi:predicted metal-binding protein